MRKPITSDTLWFRSIHLPRLVYVDSSASCVCDDRNEAHPEGWWAFASSLAPTTTELRSLPFAKKRFPRFDTIVTRIAAFSLALIARPRAEADGGASAPSSASRLARSSHALCEPTASDTESFARDGVSRSAAATMPRLSTSESLLPAAPPPRAGDSGTIRRFAADDVGGTDVASRPSGEQQPAS